ncbi:hypothetical protein [Acinetobacter courvalinii]|uniref:hypothetical protein n=1 Tax=Acinetobacter courvalinii TaxID=280147 RepID=UPI00289B2DBA|nr:hypothetical protein [Acinetobacter courvalinii]
MVCKSCEERREWMEKQIATARERTAEKIARIRSLVNKVIGAEPGVDSTEHNIDSADSEQGSDNPGSTGTEQRAPVATKRAGRGKAKVENVGLSEVDNEQS